MGWIRGKPGVILRMVLVAVLGSVGVVALSEGVRGRLLDALFGPSDDATAIPPTGPSPIPPRT